MTNEPRKVIDFCKYIEDNTDKIYVGWLDGGSLCDQIEGRYSQKSTAFKIRILEMIENLFIRRIS